MGERIISGIIGGLFTVRGLKRHSLSRVIWTTLGGALLARGFSGHCKAYSALHIDHAHKTS